MFIFILLFFTSLISKYDFNVKTSLLYKTESNVFLKKHELFSCSSLSSELGLFAFLEKRGFTTKTQAKLAYDKYFTDLMALSHLDLFFDTKNSFFLSTGRSVFFDLEYKKTADIVPLQGPFLEYRNLKVNIYSIDTKSVWSLKPIVVLDLYDSDMTYFDRVIGDFSLFLLYQFLPRTNFYTGLEYKWISHSDLNLYDANYYALVFGLKGLFTKTTEGALKFSLIYLKYADGLSFNEPNLELSFKTLLSSVNYVKIAFLRKVEDSFYSDFYVDTGFKLSSQFLLLDSWVFRIGARVSNRKYWNMSRRDIISNGTFELYYPIFSFRYFKNFAIFLKLDYENKLTDAYNIAQFGPDPALNYDNFKILFGFTNEY